MTEFGGPQRSAKSLVRPVAVGLAVVTAAAGLALTVPSLMKPVASPDVVGPAPTAQPQSSPVPPSAAPTVAAAPPEKQRRKQKRRAKPRPTPSPSPQGAAPAGPVDPKFRPFTGLSTWIDIYDVDLTPKEQIARAAAGGVQLVFVQSARHKSKADIDDAPRLTQVIDGAHDHGMLVMVWYVPDFVRTARDLRRSQAAIAFQTPRGDRADAFGLDIEVEDQPDIARRNANLLALSARLRQWAGPDYPMAAVVLPPLQLDLRPGWWPQFPWAQLRQHYDVFVPMSYSSYRGTDKRTTYRWNVANVEEMRRLTGDPTLPVHVAGGIADNFPQVGTFVQAVRDVDALGGGLYDLHTTHPDAWAILRGLRATQPN